MNYINKLINSDIKNYNIIPFHWHFYPAKFYNITFEGWKGFDLNAESSILMEMTTMAAIAVKGFINLYKDTHAFTEPNMWIKPDGNFGVKIATMEIELYNEKMEKDELDKK